MLIVKMNSYLFQKAPFGALDVNPGQSEAKRNDTPGNNPTNLPSRLWPRVASRHNSDELRRVLPRADICFAFSEKRYSLHVLDERTSLALQCPCTRNV